jgi:Zn-dependent protease with chaperone function
VTSEVTSERPCPECHAPVPVVPGYPDWCDSCGWNLKPPPARERPDDRFARIATALGRRAGDRMARQLLAARELQPRLTAANVAAYAVAAGVHLVTFALIAGGIAGIVVDFPNALSFLLGAGLIGLGWLMRPRAFQLGDDVIHLDPDRTPALHKLAADVAAALDRPPPDEIVADARWNASWAPVGGRRRRVLMLGVPLWAALEPQERVALVAHELGHDRNGDLRRGLFIGSAVEGLSALAWLLVPPSERPGGADFMGLALAEWISGGLMWLISRPVVAVLWIEARLLLRDSQRAEYLADALAARVAGTQAVVALHERTLLWSTFELVVQHAAHENATDVLDRLRVSIQLVPDRERDRRRRVARLKQSRLDDSHPPTGMRIEMLEGRPATEPQVVLNTAQSHRIDAELEPLAERIDREMLDAYRGRLYTG